MYIDTAAPKSGGGGLSGGNKGGMRPSQGAGEVGRRGCGKWGSQTEYGG